jgi:hypothetical protein
MKSLLVLVLAFALTGCSALAPTLATPGPTSTPQVIIQTVVVTVLVTAPPTETPIPTATWTPIPTFTPQPTDLTPLTTTPGTPAGTVTGTAQMPQASASGSPTATLPADAGGGIFTNLTRSADNFSYSCQPNTITFGVSTTNTSITEVDFFYRLEDQSSSAITGWVDVSKMLSDNSGNFTFDFKASYIPRDLRFSKAWFDYQFVALNNLGKVVGRSATILKQATFMLNCAG